VAKSASGAARAEEKVEAAKTDGHEIETDELQMG
jgi:hypothetical protein